VTVNTSFKSLVMWANQGGSGPIGPIGLKDAGFLQENALPQTPVIFVARVVTADLGPIGPIGPACRV